MAMVSRIGNAIVENETLIHLSLSNNQFDLGQLAVLSKILQGNHTLLGLHLSHPNAYIDAHGFLHVTGSAGVAADEADPDGDGGAAGGEGGDGGSGGGGGFAEASAATASHGMMGGTREAGDKLRPTEWLHLAPMRERRKPFKYKNCWICAGYSERRFQVVIHQDAPDKLSKRALTYGVCVDDYVVGFACSLARSLARWVFRVECRNRLCVE